MCDNLRKRVLYLCTQMCIRDSHHVPSDTEKRREAVKAKIQDIYDDSKQNYGAPKITVEPVSYTHLDVYKRQG